MTFTRRTLTLLLVIVTLSMPLAVFAQGGDDELELEDFVSEDELFTAVYPAEWVVIQDEYFPLPHFMAATSEETMEKINGEEPAALDAGESALFAFVLPLDVIPMFGVELVEDPTLTDIAVSFAESFFAPEDPDAFFEIGEAEEVTLESDEDDAEDIEAVFVPMTETLGQTGMLAFYLADDLIGVVVTATSEGEWTEAQDALLETVALSLNYDGTGADLLEALMAPPPIEEAPEGVTADDYDGEELIAELCTACHTTERIDAADYDEEGWTQTVDRMIGYGIELNTAQREAIINYLIETH